MGKRKSKTSKQKQAKAAAKSLKCRVVNERHLSKKQQVPSGMPPLKGKGKRRKGTAPVLSEKDDYKRQQASMQERHLAEEQRRKIQKQQRGKKLQHDTNASASSVAGQGATNSRVFAASSFAFQAPTLVVDDGQKSTQQLLTDLTQKTQGWDGIAPSTMTDDLPAVVPQPQGAINLKQIFEQTKLQQQQEFQERYAVETKNRFAALANMDDDDDDEANGVGSNPQATTAPQSLFQFAPASFSLATPVATAVGPSDDVDPDL